MLWVESGETTSNCPGPIPSGFSVASSIPVRWALNRSVSYCCTAARSSRNFTDPIAVKMARSNPPAIRIPASSRPARLAPPRRIAAEDDHDRHDGVDPRAPREREQDAGEQDPDDRKLERGPKPDEARLDRLLEHDRRGRNQEWTEHVRVLEEGLSALGVVDLIPERHRQRDAREADQR
jgi:hypothetical protein